MGFLVARPFWNEISFGVLGIFTAWGLKKGEKFAWKLGVFWSIMLIASGVIIAFNEVVVSGWTTVCMLPVNLFVVGVVSQVLLQRSKKWYL